mgnify:CR=1 FL=1
MGYRFKQLHLRVNDDMYEKINNIANKRGESISSVMRELLEKGLANEWVDENTDLITHLVKQQVDATMKPHVERLATLTSKVGHMSATATFLNVQAFKDLVPTERKKDVKDLYEKARKKAVTYMKIPVRHWEDDY